MTSIATTPVLDPNGVPVMPPGRRPGVWMFVLAALLGVASLVAVGVAVMQGVGIFSDAANLKRFTAPGSMRMTVDEPTTVRIFRESGVPLQPTPVDATTDARITVRRVENGDLGTAVSTSKPSGTFTYDFGSHRGIQIATARLPEAGTYEVAVTEPAGMQVAVGEFALLSGIGGIIGGIFAAIGLAFASVGLLVAGVVRRKGYQRRAATFEMLQSMES